MNLTGLGVVLAVGVMAQGTVRPAQAPGVVETPHLLITTSASVPSPARGARLSLFVDVAPKPRMHVYAPEQSDYLPVSLQVAPRAGVMARRPLFPKGESFVFAPTRETQVVFSKPFRIEVPLTVGRSAAPGPLEVSGTLQYQACDDKVCYVPRTVALTWTVLIR